MGNSNWSDEHYSNKMSATRAAGKSAFDYHTKVSSGVASGAHETLDPAKMKAGNRECRDSDEHPNSLPIYVGLDVTGSMQSVPKTMQAKLKELMGLLLRKGYAEDPSICISAIGDVYCDRVPFQVGQFESGIEIDDNISNLYLEGGGGGNKFESYDLPLYFLARCVKTDAWEKRGKKGYAIIICDEHLPEKCTKAAVQKVFGQTIQADIPIEDLINEVKERWNLFCIVPNMTSHFRTAYQDKWKSFLGQDLIYLEDPATIAESIASLIGLAEGNTDLESMLNDLQDVGLNSSAASSVTTALSKVGTKTELSTFKGTGLVGL